MSLTKEDKILASFLKHSLLREKYNLSTVDVSIDFQDALISEEPVIRTIAYVIQSLERIPPKSDKDIYDGISKILNTAI